MARRSGRRAAMVAAGLATAMTPFVVAQGAAHAAETVAQDEEPVQFVTHDGVLLSCAPDLLAIHDTDDPNRPTLTFFSGIDGDFDCTDSFQMTATATYRDASGHVQRSTVLANDQLFGVYENAHTHTSVTLTVRFNNCDDSQSPTCIVTLTASPK